MISELKGFEIALHYMSQWHSRRIYNRWIEPLKISEKTSVSVVLIAPTNQMAEEISLLFGASLLDAIRKVWPEIGCLRIKPAKIPAPKHHRAPAQLSMRLVA